jgi:RND family efflux transporter MFP subunit
MDSSDAFEALPAAPVRGATGSRRMRVALAIGALLFVILALVGLLPRLHLWRRLDQQAQVEKNKAPAVTTARPERAPVVVDVPLPGTTEPLLTTGIYARTDGYLKARYVDIGDHVKAGQLLADITAPEVDQQLSQTLGTLAQGKANVVRLQADLNLAQTTLRRFVAIGVGAVTQQEIDERAASQKTAQKAVDAAEATVHANQADVDRLRELQGFQRVYAPFDGIITARNVDPGSLISAGSTSVTTQLFSLAQVDTLRIFVFVPQTYAFDVQVGQSADVTLREQPDRVFKGIVTRTAGAIDPASRTLLTEVDVPNRDGALLSGSYVTVHFKIQRSEPPLLIPGPAMLAGSQGTRVAVVGADDTLHYRPVTIGRDFGDRVEVLGGLEESDVIVTDVPGGIADGAKVRPRPAQAPAQPAAGSPAAQQPAPGKGS